MIMLPPPEFHAKYEDRDWRAIRSQLISECRDEALIDTKLHDSLDDMIAAKSALPTAEEQRFTTLGRLVPGIAHDVNNLLAVMCGYAELLSEHFTVDDPRRGFATLIGDLGQQAGELLQYVSGLSRVPEVAHVDLPELFDKVARLLPRYIGANLECRVECAPGLGSIAVDPIEAMQLILNLVGNARDSTPAGGAIIVRAGIEALKVARPGWPQTVPCGQFVAVTVSDNGCGMEAATLQRIFEPYFTTRADCGGTGIGLATVARIVGHAGGFIQVESAPGWGTRFRLYFPIEAN